MKMKVLIADDSDLILVRLQECLSVCKGLEIVGVSKNGIDTLENLRKTKPDLAVIDLRMSGLNGLEVLQEIRKENKTVKIIILTLYSSDYYKQKAIQLGADYFLNKADDFDKVVLVAAEMTLKGGKN